MVVLSASSLGLGWRNGEIQREAISLRHRLDSLLSSSVPLDRQARLLAAVDRVVPEADGEAKLVVVQEIDRNASIYGFDPLIILAVVLTESRLDLDAIGKFRSGAASGARGVMQIKLSTARPMALSLGMGEPTENDLDDPGYNLTVGVAYLLKMVHRYRDLRLGIMAYNVGPGGVESALRGTGELPERYYRKVWLAYRRLSAELDRI